MKPKRFTLNGKTYTNAAEYKEARDNYLAYQDEQEQAVAKYGFCSEIQVLDGTPHPRANV
ncbi:MAG: hypothetical protein IJ064_05745 [Bacteroidaceae bacterium]|nr:hypothetical protein [Bacteroidaceae bacterium]